MHRVRLMNADLLASLPKRRLMLPYDAEFMFRIVVSFLRSKSQWCYHRSTSIHKLTPHVQVPGAQVQVAQVQLGFPHPPIVLIGN